MSLKRYYERRNVLCRLSLFESWLVNNYDNEEFRNYHRLKEDKEFYVKEFNNVQEEYTKMLNMNFVQKLFY